MKPNKPELSAKWWSTVKPGGVDGKKDLEKALAKAEKALGDQQKKSEDAKVVGNCLGSLKSLPGAISKTIRECDKKKHKDEIKGLQEMKKMVDAEVARLEKLKKDLAAGGGEEEGDEDESKMFDDVQLKKLLKQVKSGGKEYYFGFGLDMSEPTACVLGIDRKRKGTLIDKKLKKEKGFSASRLRCHGTLLCSPGDRKTLLFKLAPESNTPPSKILKIARVMFRMQKDIYPFKKLMVQPFNGDALEDAEPDDDVAEGGEKTGRPTVTPEQKEEAREGITRIEEELRRMAAENNINV